MPGELKGYLGGFIIAGNFGYPKSQNFVADGSTRTFTLSVDEPDPRQTSVTLSDAASEVSLVWIKDYSVHPAGRIMLHNAPDSDTSVKVSTMCALEYRAQGGFTGWTCECTCDVLDTSSFGEQAGGTRSAWRTQKAGLKSWTGTAERHWMDDEGLAMSDLGNLAVVRFYTDLPDSRCYCGYAYITGVNPTAAVDALVDEPLTFTGVDALFTESTTA